jgi:RNA polymerase sigma factor (sigma-70 family)
MSVDLVGAVREKPKDQRRWAAWYRLMYPRLYFIAYRLTKGNAAAAQDLVQDTFARFLDYRAIERVTNDNHSFAFLVTTCRRLAYDRNVSPDELKRESFEEVDLVAAPGETADSSMDVERMLQALGPEDRQLMHWARQGLSVSEIAARLRVTYSAAGVRLHRLRKQLRDAYKSDVKISPGGGISR